MRFLLVFAVLCLSAALAENDTRCDNHAFFVWESADDLRSLAENMFSNASRVVRLYRQMHAFHSAYIRVHVWLSLVVCAFGIGANVLTVFVFTQPGMLSPINCLLIGVAFCDGFVMGTYLVYTLHFHVFTREECDVDRYSFAWTVFTWLHANSALVLHGSSLWIECFLALTRVLMLRSRTSGGHALTNRQSVGVMLLIFILTSIAFVPNYLSLRIEKIYNYEEICARSSIDSYALMSDRRSPQACNLGRLSFWLNGVVFKFLPAILLSILVCLLVSVMREANRRRLALRQSGSEGAKDKRLSIFSILRRSESTKPSQADSTSQMLLTLLAILLTTEIPQGVLTLLNGMSSDGFRFHFYENIADLLDFLSLLNCAINFPLYCVMSQKFRMHCVQLLKAPLKRSLAWRRDRAEMGAELLPLHRRERFNEPNEPSKQTQTPFEVE